MGIDLFLLKKIKPYLPNFMYFSLSGGTGLFWHDVLNYDLRFEINFHVILLKRKQRTLILCGIRRWFMFIKISAIRVINEIHGTVFSYSSILICYSWRRCLHFSFNPDTKRCVRVSTSRCTLTYRLSSCLSQHSLLQIGCLHILSFYRKRIYEVEDSAAIDLQ